MARRTKSFGKEKRISRSASKTHPCDYDEKDRPICPCCGGIHTSKEYDYDDNTKELTFYYRCPECGTTYYNKKNLSKFSMG